MADEEIRPEVRGPDERLYLRPRTECGRRKPLGQLRALRRLRHVTFGRRLGVKRALSLPQKQRVLEMVLYDPIRAVGCTNGSVFIADTLNYSSDSKVVKLLFNSPVSAIAALNGEPGKFACIQNNDTLSLGGISPDTIYSTVKVPGGIAPFTLVTGDINNDTINEIVVCDSRKGLWVFTRHPRSDTLITAPGWEQAPIDWATAGDTSTNRSAHAINTAPPALADINGDGRLEIIVGGSNGLFALNYKGVIINGWPSYLDNRFYRGNVACSPAIISAPQGSSGSLVIYQSPTGENETFEIDTIIKANKASGIIKFIKTDGDTDSITGLTPTFIDSATVLGDSLILPYVLPGGLVDAVNPTGKRPSVISPNSSNQLYSQWPLSLGSPEGASPLVDTIGSSVNVFAIGGSGWVYRWKLDSTMVGSSLIWKQTGYNGSRSFAYLAGYSGNSASQISSISRVFLLSESHERQQDRLVQISILGPRDKRQTRYLYVYGPTRFFPIQFIGKLSGRKSVASPFPCKLRLGRLSVPVGGGRRREKVRPILENGRCKVTKDFACLNPSHHRVVVSLFISLWHFPHASRPKTSLSITHSALKRILLKPIISG